MKINQNTVLITGGSAGIGFEIAKLFSQNGNQVIITGRNEERLQSAVSQLDKATAIVSDVSKEEDVLTLVNQLNKDFPDLNIVVNNAGLAYLYDLANENAQAFEKASAEILTNYLSIVRLNEKLLPLLKKQNEAAIVNVSSITAFAGAKSIPSYSISKSALHAYSQILRLSLEAETKVKVFELMPPLVDTEFSKDIGGSQGIKPLAVAERLLEALKNDEYEIRVGGTADLYKLFLSSPSAALNVMNGR